MQDVRRRHSVVRRGVKEDGGGVINGVSNGQRGTITHGLASVMSRHHCHSAGIAMATG